MPNMSSANVIGFYLQLEDDLSPILTTVERAYKRLEQTITRSNERIVTKTRTAFSKLVKLSNALVQSQERAASALNKGSTGAGSADASRMKISLSPTYPKRKSPFFEGLGLRQKYRQMTQPPGYEGFIELPRFQEGGFVEGSAGQNKNADSVLAMLQPGELVVPKDLTDALRQAAEQPTTKMPTDSKETQDAFTSMRRMPSFKSMADYREAVVGLQEELAGMTDATTDEREALILNSKAMSILNNRMAKYRQIARSVNMQVSQLPGYQRDAAEMSNLLSSSMQDNAEGAGMASEAYNGLAQVLANVKEAFTGAIQQHGAGIASLGAAAFTAAAFQEDDWIAIREQMNMTDAAFERLRQSGMRAMSDIGIASEEMNTILKQAAFYQLEGEAVDAFVNTAALSTQALQAIGVDTSEVMDLMWDGLMKVGVAADKTGGVINSLAHATKIGNIEFSALADMIKQNNTLFNEIALSGGKVEEAMAGMAGMTAEMGDYWLDTTETMDFANDVLDPGKMSEISARLNTISRQTGMTVQDMRAKIRAGGEGLAEVMAADVLGAASVPLETVRNMGDEAVQTMYGFSKAAVLQAHQAKQSAGGIDELRESLMQSAREAIDASGNTQVLEESWKAFNASIEGVVTRIKNSVLPVLYSFGEVLVTIASTALTPIFWITSKIFDIYSALPGPLKLIASVMLGLYTVIVGVSAAQSILANSAMAAATAEFLRTKATIAGAFASTKALVIATASAASKYALAAATGIATAAQWMFNVAIGANPVGGLILVIGIAVGALATFAYGLATGAKWAQYLGAALLFLTGPVGVVVGGILLAIRLFRDWGAISEWVGTKITALADWIGGFADRFALMLPKLVDSLIAWVNKIPEMIQNAFSGEAVESGLGGKLKDAFLKIGGALITVWWTLMKEMPAVMLAVIGGIGNVLAELIAIGLVKVYDLATSLMMNLWDSVMKTANTFAKGILQVFSGDILGGLKNIGASIMRAVLWPFTAAWDYLFGNTVWSADTISSVFYSIVDTLKSVGSVIIDVLTWPFRTAMDLVTSIWSSITGLFDMNGLQQMVMDVGNSIVEWMPWPLDSALEWFFGEGNATQNAPTVTQNAEVATGAGVAEGQQQDQGAQTQQSVDKVMADEEMKTLMRQMVALLGSVASNTGNANTRSRHAQLLDKLSMGGAG